MQELLITQILNDKDMRELIDIFNHERRIKVKNAEKTTD